MACSFCGQVSTRRDIEMWGSFHCPHCHQMLRVYRNYPLRILRLVIFTAAPLLILLAVSDFLEQHFLIKLTGIGTAAAAIDEYVMRLFPVRIEPASPGGLGLSSRNA